MAEENTWRIGTAMDFWDFLLENHFLKGGKVSSCGQAQLRQVWYPSKKRIWSYSLQKNVHYCIMYGETSPKPSLHLKLSAIPNVSKRWDCMILYDGLRL